MRANALGDFIFALPALCAIKETYPKAQLVYLGKQWHKEFLKNRPSPIDRVISIPPFPGVGENENSLLQPQGLEAAYNFFKQMKQEQFDVAIQLHGGGKNSNPFLLKLGAKLNVGLKTQNAPPFYKWIPYVYYHNEVLRYLEVVSLIDAKTKHISPTITVTNNDKKEALFFYQKQKNQLLFCTREQAI